LDASELLGLLLQFTQQLLRVLDEFLALFNKALELFNVFDIDFKGLLPDLLLSGGHNGSLSGQR